MAPIELSEAEWRDCYYVYRALHDGVCPNCGESEKPAATFKVLEGIRCPSCLYGLGNHEIEAVLSRSKNLLKRRLDAVIKYRRVYGDTRKSLS